jgi:hypothetical protein
MKFNKKSNDNLYLFDNIIKSAMLIGGISFAVGFVGPLLFSSSNIGPLIGIFITGPIGGMVGVIWGIVKSSRNANADNMNLILKALLIFWAITMLFLLFIMSFSQGAAFLVICLQGFIIVSSILMLFPPDSDSKLPENIKQIRLVIVITLIFIMLVSLFPPVTIPDLLRNASQESIDLDNSLPSNAFILDKRFDASIHFPLFVINKQLLIIEWILTIIVTFTINEVIIFQKNRKSID